MQAQPSPMRRSHFSHRSALIRRGPGRTAGTSQFTYLENISEPSLARRPSPLGRCHRRSPPIGTSRVSGCTSLHAEALPASCCPCWHPFLTVRAWVWTWPSIRIVVIVVAKTLRHLRAQSAAKGEESYGSCDDLKPIVPVSGEGSQSHRPSCAVSLQPDGPSADQALQVRPRTGTLGRS